MCQYYYTPAGYLYDICAVCNMWWRSGFCTSLSSSTCHVHFWTQLTWTPWTDTVPSAHSGVRVPDSWWKREWVRVLAGVDGESSSGSTFCVDSYFSISSTPMIPQQHVRDPGHSAKRAGGSLQPNMHASCKWLCKIIHMVYGCMVYTMLQDSSSIT